MKSLRYASFVLVLFASINNFAQSEFDNLKQKLIDGNKLFLQEESNHPSRTTERREEVAAKQNPFAVVVSCSDSRVPPEVVFHQGYGDLFVIRCAGNVLDDFGIASIEYAVEHLGVKLVVVLGHERCGAVAAAVSGAKLPGHLPKLIRAITPAVKESKKMNGDLLYNSIHQNILDVVKQLKKSKPILNEFVHEHKLEVAGAYYDLDKGTVNYIE